MFEIQYLNFNLGTDVCAFEEYEHRRNSLTNTTNTRSMFRTGIEVGIILQRDVTAGDLHRAAKRVGVPLLHYGERIDFRHSASSHRRDLKFISSTQHKLVYDQDGGISTPACSLWIQANKFETVRLYFTGSFQIAEILHALKSICREFGARPSTIMNRSALNMGENMPADGDSVQDINDFWEFDVAAAVEEFTIEGNDKLETDRLFKCWICSTSHDSHSFHAEDAIYGEYVHGRMQHHDLGKRKFYRLLGYRVVRGVEQACNFCVQNLTTRPVKRQKCWRADVPLSTSAQ